MLAVLALALFAVAGFVKTVGDATPTVVIQSEAGAPIKAPPRSAGKTPLRKPDAGAPSPYDKNGLVDGGIPGAPPGWKPATLTPPGGGVPSDAGGGP